MYSNNSGLTWTPFATYTQTALSATNSVLTATSPTLLAGSAWFKIIAINGICNPDESDILKITVSSQPTAGSITGGNITVCASASSALNLSGNTTSINNTTTLSVSNYTPGATLLWQKSINYSNTIGATPVWTAAGSTSSTLIASNLSVDTWYRVKITNGANIAYTDIVKITVSKTALAGSITSSTASVCSGGTITFTSGTYTGDSIQWEVSTTSATSGFVPVSGATNNTFIMSNVSYAPLSSFYVRYVVTSGTCTIARACAKAIIVNPLSQGGTITGGGTVCSSGGGVLKITGNVGTIKWQYSIDGSNFTNVPSGNTITPTFGTTSTSGTASTYIVTNVTGTTYFRALVTSGACSSSTSNIIQYVIGTNATAGTLNAVNTSICAGNATTLNLTGYVGSITKWEKSTNWTSSTPTWTSVTSTSPILNTGNLTTSTAYRTIVSIGSCSTVTSNQVIINVPVKPLSKGISTSVTSSASSPICNNTTITLNVTQGYIGTIQWQKSTDNVTFSTISGAISTDYTISNPAIGANYFRVAFTNSCGVTVYSNVLTIYFKNCATPTSKTVEKEEPTPFGVVAAPIPFSEKLTLNLTTSSEDKVKVMVYDMVGKLVDQREVSPSDASTLEIGDQFPSGVYNLIVTQGDNTKVIRVIKR